jgi:hypothetical protein
VHQGPGQPATGTCSTRVQPGFNIHVKDTWLGLCRAYVTSHKETPLHATGPRPSARQGDVQLPLVPSAKQPPCSADRTAAPDATGKGKMSAPAGSQTAIPTLQPTHQALVTRHYGRGSSTANKFHRISLLTSAVSFAFYFLCLPTSVRKTGCSK